jgi:hypothetical protein
MTDPTELEAALRANLALIEDAQRLMADYRSKRTQATALIDNLLLLLDGPQQRDAKELADKALTVHTFQNTPAGEPKPFGGR